MERQTKLECEPLDCEVIVDEEITGEEEANVDSGPWDIEDRLYEEWRDRKMLEEEPGNED